MVRIYYVVSKQRYSKLGFGTIDHPFGLPEKNMSAPSIISLAHILFVAENIDLEKPYFDPSLLYAN